MQARVNWDLIIFGTQVIKKKRPVRPVFPDYLSISYDYYHTKSTDKYQYLNYTSAHPAHTKRSFIYSQALRMSRICSFEKHLLDMKSWFQTRRCPSDVVQKEINKDEFSVSWDKNKNKKKSKGAPTVITFHPLLKGVGNIIHKNLYLLCMDRED